MSVLVEGITFVARRQHLESEFAGGVERFIEAVNALEDAPMFVVNSEPNLVSVAFRDDDHAQGVLEVIGYLKGDWTLVDAEDGPVTPADWLKWSTRAGVTRAWLAGTRPGKLAVSGGMLRLAVENGVETLLDFGTGAQIQNELPLPPEDSPTPVHDALLVAIDGLGWKYHFNQAPSAIVDLLGDTGLYSTKFYANEAAQIVSCMARAALVIPPPARRRTMEFVTRANYAMLSGAFELSLDDGVLGFRDCINVAWGPLTSQVVRACSAHLIGSMDRYMPHLMEVIYGKRSVREAIEAAES